MHYYQDPWNFTLGIVLIVVGSAYLIEAIFGIQIPIFKILLGLLLTYWGLKMLTSPIPIIKKKCTYWYRHYVNDDE
jgi:small neutral amino acid transporter SnatA (MarC family)